MRPFDKFMATLRTMHDTKTPLPWWAKMPNAREVDILWPTMIPLGDDAAFEKRLPKYIRSKAWRERRAVVLILARMRCIHCLRKKATQVHHNTYDNWRAEPLTDLDPICRGCHCRIHHIPYGAGFSLGALAGAIVADIEAHTGLAVRP